MDLKNFESVKFVLLASFFVFTACSESPEFAGDAEQGILEQGNNNGAGQTEISDGLNMGVSDPGPGMGLWKPSPEVFVFDRTMGGSDTHVPGCIPNEYVNCQWAHTANSLYKSVKAGEIWAMRIPYTSMGSGLATVNVALAEAGANLQLSFFDISLTKNLGDFDRASPQCRLNSISQGRLFVLDAVNGDDSNPGASSACRLEQNTLYYLNVRPAVGFQPETLCGSSSEHHCRLRLAPRISGLIRHN